MNKTEYIETLKKIRLLAGAIHENVEECFDENSFGDLVVALDYSLEIIGICAAAEGLPVVVAKNPTLRLIKTGYLASQDAA